MWLNAQYFQVRKLKNLIVPNRYLREEFPYPRDDNHELRCQVMLINIIEKFPELQGAVIVGYGLDLVRNSLLITLYHESFPVNEDAGSMLEEFCWGEN